ncbi:MAG: ABC transporter permease [Candidatus Dadabacteria bacterium]|nr:MAG: ABC transporter permease [Candidatus Dadabacteria bacterium]
MLRLLRQVSWRQLRLGWGRALLVVGGVATGVALIVAIAAINTSVLRHFAHTIELMAGPAQLEVTLGSGEVGFREEVADIVRSDPDVVAAISLVRGTVSLADAPGRTLQLFGADFFAEEDLERYHITTTTDRRKILASIGDPNTILLTERLANELGVGLGERVELALPAGVRSLKVVGLLGSEGLAAAFGGMLAIMDLPAAQIALDKVGRIDQIDVVLPPEVPVEVVRKRLATRLPAGLQVERPEHRAAYYEQALRSFQAMLTGLSMLCLIAAVFIIYNTTSTAALQRIPDIARLLVIGAQSGRLFALLITEAFLLALLGVGAGLALGVVLARLLVPLVTQSMGVIFQLRFEAGDIGLDPKDQAWAAAAGIVAALFASVFAARTAARAEPLAVLHDQNLDEIRRVRIGRFCLLWAALVGVSVLALAGEAHYGSIALGNIGATLWNASAIVIAVPLVVWTAGPLQRLAVRWFGPSGRVAIESLRRSARRSGITIAAIALVMTVGIFVSSLALSFRQSMRAYIGQFLAADLTVSAVATEGGWLETPLPERLAGVLASIDGVRAVDAVTVLPGQSYQGLRIGVAGFTDGFFNPARYPKGWFREGDMDRALRALKAGTGANISTGLADRTGLHAGDRITLATPTGPLTLPIVGVVPDYISDKGTVIVNRRLVRDRWLISTVHRFFLTVDPRIPLARVRRAIADTIGKSYRIKSLSLREVLAYHDDKINSAFRFTSAIQLLVVIVTLTGILDLLVSAILERRRELAVLRLIGAEDHLIRTSILVESGAIGILGSILGAFVGLATAWVWIHCNFRYLLGYYLEEHFAWLNVLGLGLLAFATTTAGGFLAGRQATRIALLEILRAE